MLSPPPLSSPQRSHDAKQPYAVPTRKERSRELAQKRRTTYKSLMNDMAEVLPFSKEVVSQVDYNSRLRLALCFIRMKKILGADSEEEDEVAKKSVKQKTGLFQDLVVESLDGFLMTCTGDGTIIHLSETIHKHLGLFQSEHIGFSLYDLVHEDDHMEVRRSLSQAESRALSKQGSIGCSFFCRMKCSKSKLSNSATKSPGYKLVYISGQFKLHDDGSFLTAVVHPVSPPSILEIRMEGNMFVTHYTLDMRCTFFDGRLKNLMGFEKEDLVGHVPFEYHHHEDVNANLECSKGLMERGEGLSGYYRFMNKFGVNVWMQSRGIMMFDSRTGKPSYIVCMNYVISKEAGEKELEERQKMAAITAGPSVMDSSRSYDPFPTPRDDSMVVNPFEPANAADYCLSVSSLSPPESRASPDFFMDPQSLSVKHKDVVSDSDDLGYNSLSSHGGSVVSPQSVSSSVANEEPGSCCNSVFHGSPQSCHSPDLSMEGVTLTSHQQQSAKHASLLTTLLTTGTSYRDQPRVVVPSSSSSSGTNYTHSANQSFTSYSDPRHSALRNQQPAGYYSTGSVNGANKSVLYYSNQQPLAEQQMAAARGTAKVYSQVPLINSFGVQFNGGFQMLHQPQVDLSAAISCHPRNLPVLSVEDVQLLTSNR